MDLEKYFFDEENGKLLFKKYNQNKIKLNLNDRITQDRITYKVTQMYKDINYDDINKSKIVIFLRKIGK